MHKNVKTIKSLIFLILIYCYISVNNKRWVRDQLIDVLESDELGYTLCIHNRDFLPGSTIINNIYTSMEHSRRLIAVVTR